MTTSITRRYTVAASLALLLAVTATASASEVTGTLSSDSAANSTLATTSDSITGTVIDGSSGGGSRSSGSRSNNSDVSDTSSGTVLGATANSPSSPGFPNAGTAPDTRFADPSLWSALMNFIRNVFSF